MSAAAVSEGSLKDEDFPPVVAPYSATLERAGERHADLCRARCRLQRRLGPDFRVGAVRRLSLPEPNRERVRLHPDRLQPIHLRAFPIPNQVKAITQDNNWYSVRLGVDAAFDFDRFRLSLDAACVPYAWLYGADTHWLRLGSSPGDFTGPIPEDGKGWGYQLEAFLSYRVTEALSVGIGGRYWYMQTRGFTHFEDHVVAFTALPQVVEWKTQNFGVFLQGSLKFGPIPVLESTSQASAPFAPRRWTCWIWRDGDRLAANDCRSVPLTRRAMERLLRATVNTWHGLLAAARSEEAFRQELVALVLAVPLAFVVAEAAWKRLALIGVVLLLLVVELLNTAIEKLADRVTRAIDPQIGRVKDMGSAAVGLALLIAGAAWLLALAERLGSI